MKRITIFFAVVAVCSSGDVSRTLQAPLDLYNFETVSTTTQGPPNPYSFQYSAGRYPGHVDRTQSETGDGSGHVQGSYSYIDPKMKVRTVEYHVDENGFHPSLINYEDVLRLPADSEAVRRGKERHRILYEKIAAANSRGSLEQHPKVPKDSPSVEREKNRHFYLYRKIAAEHAAIGAEREAGRLDYEATSVPNEVNESEAYFN